MYGAVNLPAIEPYSPGFRAILGREGAILTLKCPKEKCVVIMTCPVHGDVSREAPANGKRGIRKGVFHLEIYDVE